MKQLTTSQSQALSDKTVIKGMQWGDLKRMLRDPTFNRKAFTNSLTNEEAEIFIRLSQEQVK